MNFNKRAFLMLISVILSACSSADRTSGTAKLIDSVLTSTDMITTNMLRVTYSGNIASEKECTAGAYLRRFSTFLSYVPYLSHAVYECDSLSLAHIAFERLATADPYFIRPVSTIKVNKLLRSDESRMFCGDWPNGITKCKSIARYGYFVSAVEFVHPTSSSQNLKEEYVMNLTAIANDHKLYRLKITP